MINHFHVVVNHHNRVIDNHTQNQNQRRQRHHFEFDAEEVEHGQRYQHRNWHCDARHRSHAQRQKQHCHADDGDDGNQELAHKVVHRLLHVFRQFRNLLNVNSVRQLSLECLDGLVHSLAVLDNVVAVLHFERQQNGLAAVLLDVTVGVVVAALNGGYILESHHVAVWVRIDNLLGKVFFRLIILAKMKVQQCLAVVNVARVAHKPVRLERAQQR